MHLDQNVKFPEIPIFYQNSNFQESPPLNFQLDSSEHSLKEETSTPKIPEVPAQHFQHSPIQQYAQEARREIQLPQEKLQNNSWHKSENVPETSIEIRVGEKSYQVNTYETDLKKKELVRYSSNNNCSFESSENYSMYSTEKGVKFRSKAEAAIYFALSETGVYFMPNSLAIVSSENKEPDFLVIFMGRAFILDVVSNKTHDAEKDANTGRFYQDHGIWVRSYPAKECLKNPLWVVDDFLKWIGYRNKTAVNE